MLGEDRRRITDANATTAAPAITTVAGATLYCTKRVTQKIGHTLYQHDFWYSLRSIANEHVARKTTTKVDISALVSEAMTAEVWTVGSPPSTPTLSGYVLRDKEDIEIENPLYRLRVYQWGLRTHAEDVTMPDTVYQVDQSSNVVEGFARVAVIEADATPDGGVTVSGLIARDIEKKQLVSGKWEITYIFGQTTHEEDELFAQTVYHKDPSHLEDSAVVALINSSTTYPVALDTPPTTPATGTLQLIEVKSKQRTHGGQWIHVGIYERSTNKQKIEYAGSESVDSTEDQKVRRVTTVETYSGSITTYAATIRAANVSEKTFVAARVKRINPDYVEVVLNFDDADKKVELLGSHVIRQAVRGVPASAIVGGQWAPGNIYVGDTDATVWVKYNFGNLRASPLYIDRVLGRFSVLRLYADSAIDTHAYWAIQGQINSDTFLGRLPGEVMYLGPEYVYLQDLSGTRRAAIRYMFATDNFKWFNDGYLPEGSVAVNSSSITATGGYSSTILEAGAVCTFPIQSTFAGFLT